MSACGGRKGASGNVAVMKEIGTYDPDYAPELDWDGDVNFFEEMIRRSTVRKKFPTGLQKVFDEEVGNYLAGRIDGQALDNHLKTECGCIWKNQNNMNSKLFAEKNRIL